MATEALVHESAGRRAWPALRWTTFAYAAIALLPLLLSAPFFSEPMEQDEGVYFSVALSGDLPYVSVFDHKPPLVYAWYKLALLLSGGDPDIASVRFLAAVQLSMAAIAVTWLGSLIGGRRIGIIAGLLFASTATNQYLQANANTEVFMLAPLVASVACFISGVQRGSLLWLLLAGVLCGVAMMTKSVAALNCIALVSVLAWARLVGEMSSRHAIERSIVFLAGVASVCALAVLPFAVAGHWSEFWHANVTYNLAYSAQSSLTAKVFALASVDHQAIAGSLLVWVLGAAGAVLLCQRKASPATAAVIASAVAAYLGASVTGREYPHYWVPVVPFVALFAALTVDRLVAAWSTTRARLHAEALLLALVVPSIFVVVPLYLVSADDAHLRKFAFEVNARRAVENDEVAAEIAALTMPGDRIFNFGIESQLYVLSDREPATYYTRPLAALQAEPASFERTMDELRSNPPALIADSARITIETSNSQGLAATGAAFDVAPEYRREFDAFVKEHYEFAGRVAYAELYVRKR